MGSSEQRSGRFGFTLLDYHSDLCIEIGVDGKGRVGRLTRSREPSKDATVVIPGERSKVGSGQERTT